MDRMTSSERMACLFAGKRPDRVPVIPHMEAFAGVMCGMSTYEWYNFPENAYRSQIWCQELFGYDGGKCYDVSSGIAGDFPGGEVVIPQEPRLSLPYASRLAAPTEADVEKLTLPRSIDETFDAKRILEFNRICYCNGEGVSVFAGSPTSVVQYLVGAENLVRWMIKKPELVHRLMRFATDYIYFWLRHTWMSLDQNLWAPRPIWSIWEKSWALILFWAETYAALPFKMERRKKFMRNARLF